MQVKNLLKPTHSVDGELTFASRDMSKWSTLYGVSPLSIENSYTLGHQAWIRRKPLQLNIHMKNHLKRMVWLLPLMLVLIQVIYNYMLR